MHGRVRGATAGKSSEELQELKDTLKRKTKMYTDLIGLITKMRSAGDKSSKALDLTSKVLRINPDYYTLWNYRREILIDMHGPSMGLSLDYDETKDKIAEDIGGTLRNDELQLSTEAIMKNPKAYGAWWHRCWIIQRFHTNYQHELELCSQFLDQDQRNFHCWNYRRYVVQQGNVSCDTEFGYSTDKIEQNFSNYSAFHHRSVFIEQMELTKFTSLDNIKGALQVEFAIIENATFTDPYDQSAWWYHRFILNWMKTVLQGKDESKDKGSSKSIILDTDTEFQQWCFDILDHQIENMNALMEEDPQCKWPIECLVALLRIKNELKLKENDANADLVDDIRGLLVQLKCLDPQRSGRYDYLLEKK
jgi:geranylgeranyl transferase type-2 subunit alpha